jgi:hypothetical protein
MLQCSARKSKNVSSTSASHLEVRHELVEGIERRPALESNGIGICTGNEARP